MRKLSRSFGDVFDNVCPQRKVEGGMVGGGGNDGVSGDGLVVRGSGVIEAGVTSASTSAVSSTRGSGIYRFHGGGHGWW